MYKASFINWNIMPSQLGEWKDPREKGLKIFILTSVKINILFFQIMKTTVATTS